MNELQLFNFENHEVRSLLINSEPWFVGKDVAEVLGYSNVKTAIPKHVDDEDRQILSTQNGYLENMPNRGLTVINESGLYSLILSSKLPSAKKFKRWVTSEVLPALRKTGQYQVKELSGQELMAKALIEAHSVLAAKDKVIEEMKPKALFADSVSASDDTILIRQLSKIIKGNGVDIGEKRLFKWLRDNNYLISKGSDRNTPTQKAMDLDLFKVKETVIHHSDGTIRIAKTTKVTGKGQQCFVNKFLNNEDNSNVIERSNNIYI